MKGFVQDIESLTVNNDNFRRVLYTAKHCQLVVMSLKVGEEIGAEVHTLDQFFRVEEGTGEAVLDPDEEARSIVQFVFDKFDELGSFGRLYRYLVRTKVRLGMRVQRGARSRIASAPRA